MKKSINFWLCLMILAFFIFLALRDFLEKAWLEMKNIGKTVKSEFKKIGKQTGAKIEL